ncbi:predicted protein [Naegleria gruberi]|uniref:Predicted protein n=1 Tax=Naegleria gruberi TaxID=5762 RepID=D2W5R3_NAEGR|nr:uncharacterized protein NAEGRDRAFT_76755 [Naegleria gruberi]EFC35588.1 predicted protein [Naegleria gruberi]|eukprot:XP_002668332.1 predicted protein [Naegleria gruberi strain NEG-M]
MYYINGPLHRACVLEYLPAIQWYSNKYPHFHEEQGIDCGYPLEIAIENRNTIIFEWIFNNCNLSSNVLSNALVTVADINGSAEWAQNLIKKGASIEFVQKYAKENGKQHLITYINKNCEDNKSWNFFKFFNNK